MYVIVLRRKNRATISVLNQKLEKAVEMFLLLPLKWKYLQIREVTLESKTPK